MPKRVKVCVDHYCFETWSSIDPAEGEDAFTAVQIEDMIDMLRSDTKEKGATSSSTENNPKYSIIIVSMNRV